MLDDIFGPNGYNREEEEPAKGFEPITPGKYPVQIEEVDVRPTKKQDGEYLWIQVSILEHTTGIPFKDRKLWIMLNLRNPNEKAVKIARRELSAILYATELPEIKHPNDLIGRWMYVSVKVKQDQNDINGFYHPQDPVILKMLAAPPVPAPPAAPAAPVAPAAPAAYAPPAAAPPAAAYQPPTAPPVAPAAAPPVAPPVTPPAAAPPQMAPPAAPPAPQAPPAAPPAAAPPAAAPPAAAPPAQAAPPAAPPQQAAPPAQAAGKPPWA